MVRRSLSDNSSSNNTPSNYDSNSFASLWDKTKSQKVKINGIQISHVASEWGFCYMKVPLRVDTILAEKYGIYCIIDIIPGSDATFVICVD